MGRERRIEITFKDGRSVILRPTAGEAEKAIRSFSEGMAKIEIGTLEGGLEKAIFSAQEIRSIIPQWVEIESKSSTSSSSPETKKKREPRARRGIT